MTTNNLTTTTINMNIYNNTDQTINPNMYIFTKGYSACHTINYITEFSKQEDNHEIIKINVKIVLIIEQNEFYDALKDEISHH